MLNRNDVFKVMLINTRIRHAVVCLFSLFFFIWGNLFGLSGRFAAHAFTIGEEREMGEKLLSIVRKNFDLLDDPDITQYITRLGREVLKEAGPQFFNYHFFVIKDKEFNAFAAPSGLIFLHSGLIEVMDSENELVSVLAHEAGHIESRHIANRIKKSSKVNIATAALILAGIAIGGGAVSEALIAGSMATNASMGLRFSRQDEEESDRLAFKWLQGQKRDPAAMLEMLRTMRKINLYRSGNLPPYLLTHPAPEARMNYVQDLLLFSEKQQYEKIDEFEFKRMKYRVLALTKNPQTLISHFSRNISAAKGDTAETAMEQYGLALAYLAGAEFSKAEDLLKKVLNRYPKKSILKADLGVIYYESGRYGEAYTLLNEAWTENQDCAYSAYYLALTLEQSGDVKRAMGLYEELLALLPDYSKLYYRLGNMKAAQGDKGTAYYYLGVYYWYEGDEKMAKVHLKQAMNSLPSENSIRLKAEEMLAKIERLESLN